MIESAENATDVDDAMLELKVATVVSIGGPCLHEVTNNYVASSKTDRNAVADTERAAAIDAGR